MCAPVSRCPDHTSWLQVSVAHTLNDAVLHCRQYDLPICIDPELGSESTDEDEFEDT